MTTFAIMVMVIMVIGTRAINLLFIPVALVITMGITMAIIMAMAMVLTLSKVSKGLGHSIKVLLMVNMT